MLHLTILVSHHDGGVGNCQSLPNFSLLQDKPSHHRGRRIHRRQDRRRLRLDPSTGSGGLIDASRDSEQ